VTRMGRWCFVHREKVVAGWLVAIVLCLGLGQAAGSSFNSDFSLPNSDSQKAVSLLAGNFPSASGESDQIVIQAAGGATVESPAVKAAVTAALAKVARVPGIESVTSPFSKEGAAQISPDRTVAFANVTWKMQPADVTSADANNLIKAAQSADGPDVHISLGGEAIDNSESPSIGFSVIVGIGAALIILLIVFGGALLSSLMPLLTTIIALAMGIFIIDLLTHAFSVSSESDELAILIGLGVGVDYGLFIISRHRSGVKAGLSYQDAAAQAVSTSGRTVLFAGSTVCIALLGQFALGVSLLYGVSVAAAVAVALTMAASLTFLPAMLGFLGPKVLSRRERAALEADGPSATTDVSPFWLRWAAFVQARNIFVAVGALAAVVVIALPVFSLRLGTSDDSTAPSSFTTYQAYTALAKGFGPGFNGPLELVGQVSSPTDKDAFNRLLAAAAHTPGVARVTPAVTSPNGKVVLATLYPTTSPQAEQTVSLVSTIRHDLVPQAESGNQLVVHVGGVTATNIDFAKVLTSKLPLFIAVVVLLAFLLLLAVFRSLFIPLVASAVNLLSIGAALGAMNAVFTWGWGDSILGLASTGPIDSFFPVLIFSVLFGLSMDYEVYLVSRIQEEWYGLARAESPDAEGPNGRAAWRNHQAITLGQAKSGRIIAAAAGIMILVFGSFALNHDRPLQEFGFGLGFSVLVDALVIRSLLVPAIMHLIGPANWAMPAWLDKILPNLSVEADEYAIPLPPSEEPPARRVSEPATPSSPAGRHDER
jgi:putative drug exporter of the RND superfamily